MKSITDKAEVSVDFPDKAYMGSFGKESSFDVKVGPDEVLVRILRSGDERREVAVHLHYFLLADILAEIGQGLAKQELDQTHCDLMREGVDGLSKGLARSMQKIKKKKARPRAK
jgi:hypothetical protein